MPTRIRIRRDTLTNWTNVNPILHEAEIAVVFDETLGITKLKIGDGFTEFNNLPYFCDEDKLALKDLSNVSDADFLSKILQVDGVGSGIDADKLDGLDKSHFLLSDPNYFNTEFIEKTNIHDDDILLIEDSEDNFNKKKIKFSVISALGNADTLDGLDSSQFLRSDVDDIAQGNITFAQDVVIQGNLTVNGNTTIIDVQNLEIEDNIVLLNRDESGSGVSLGTAGIQIDRGTEADAQLLFDESQDKWKVGFDGGTYEWLITSPDGILYEYLRVEANYFNNTFVEKPTPSSNDIVLIEDSEDNFSKKKVKLSNLLGSGEVSFEDLLYSNLLQDNPFDDINYDIFKSDSLTLEQGSATYNEADTKYIISDTSTTPVIFTTNVLNGTDTYYRFLVHVETSLTNNTGLTVEYSIDGGTNWNLISELDSVILVTAGFNTLDLKFIFNSDCDFYSYGVLYNYNYNSYSPDTRMFEIWNVDNNYTAGLVVHLPNNATYTTDGKSLEVYLNRLRLVNGLDFDEIDHQTVRFNVDLSQNDTVVFTEKYGYVDASIENYHRLNALAPSWTNNTADYIILRDITTNDRYKLYFDNGLLKYEVI